MQIRGLFHYHLRKRIYKKGEKFPSTDKTKRFFDRLIYFAVIIAPVFNIPQVLKVWLGKDVSGISILSWAGFSVFSIVWLIYGVLHKEKPIIFMNLLLAIMQGSVAIGAFVYG